MTSVIRSANQYHAGRLTEAQAGLDPIRLFHRWFRAAEAAGLIEPEAFALATADRRGRPSVRFVLLKHADSRGFAFFTNYESRKARELAENPWAALAVHWDKLERQVRIEGPVTRASSEESDAYFDSRLLISRLGAWASLQSRVLRDRKVLEQRVEAVRKRFAGVEPKRPPFWGGYRILPHRIEFWQGRPNRLHDRLLYTRRRDGRWKRERLSP